MANTIDEVLIRKIITRNDTAANWTAANPILDIGEVGIEYPSKKFKIGDGTTAWNTLKYSSGVLSDDSNNILGLGTDGYLYVARQINDTTPSASTTYSSNKIEQMMTDKVSINTVSTTSSTLLKSLAGKDKYNRYTSGSNITLSLTSAQNYEAGQVFNIKAVNAPITLTTSGITLSLPTGKIAKVTAGGVITVVIITPTTADVYGTLENA